MVKQACRDCPYAQLESKGLHCTLLNMNVEYALVKPCETE